MSIINNSLNDICANPLLVSNLLLSLFRGVVACLQKQIAQVQEQASGLEMQCSQLQTQVETLTQTKDVLQGRTVLL